MPIPVPSAFPRFAVPILLVWTLTAGTCGCGKPVTVSSESKSAARIIEITPDPLVITASEDGRASPVKLKLRNVSSTAIEITQPKST